MNLADPDLELLDPTPNIHSLFLHFDELFFWTKLASRAVVRWSKRMYSSAGICSYEGRGGLCDIAISEPLLKLRPRKDLIETLLHEMIHAFLFVTSRDQDRDGHGPNFKAHMYRINKSAGLNISIYHDFHDEVKLYQTHWWRCNGPCQTRKPYFGVIRRSCNRAPGPKDFWWNDHKRICNGIFIKIKEPEKNGKTTKKVLNSSSDITKYITTNKENMPSQNTSKNVNNPATNKSGIVGIKSNSSSTVVVSKKNNVVFNPQCSTKNINPPVLFSGSGNTLSTSNKEIPKIDVIETDRNVCEKKLGKSTETPGTQPSAIVQTVRSIWANKQLPSTPTSIKQNKIKNIQISSPELKQVNSNKKKAEEMSNATPPKKLKTLDDYVKAASSVLKDIYGQDFDITLSNDNKIVPIPTKYNTVIEKPKSLVINSSNLVDCPVCFVRVNSTDINKHLDECLNKEVIENINRNEKPTNDNLVNLVDNLPSKPAINGHNNLENTEVDSIDLTFIDVSHQNRVNENISRKAKTDTKDTVTVTSIVKTKSYDKQIRKSDNFIVPKGNQSRDKDIKSSQDDVINLPPIKIEPSTSKNIVNEISVQKCPCCGIKVDVPIQEHLDDCLAFFDSAEPQEGASTSFANETIVIDDEADDNFDESQTFNATGTKTPCPCCLQMIEMDEMNNHLDVCLSS